MAAAIIMNPFVMKAFYQGYVFSLSVTAGIIANEAVLFIGGFVVFNLGKLEKKKNRKKLRKFLSKRNVAFVIFIALMMFIAAEATLRALKPEEPFYENDALFAPMPYLMHTNQPDYTFCREANAYLDPENAGKEMCYSFNSLGFRGDLPDPEDDSEYTIILLGGSAAFNGEPLENSIAKKVERNLRDMGLEKVRVYNWGVTSYNSGQELAALLYHGIDLDPEMVIVYDGANELQQYFYDPRPGYPHAFASNEKAIKYFSNETNNLDIPDLFLLSVRRLESMKFLTERVFRRVIDYQFTGISQLRAEVGYGTDEWKERIVDNYVRNIEKMSMISEAADFRLAVFMQPLVHFKRPLVGAEIHMVSTLDFQEFVNDTYPEMSLGIKSLSWEYPKNRYYDFSSLLSGHDAQIFWDYIHITHEGNEIVAENIAERIYPLIEEDLRSI